MERRGRAGGCATQGPQCVSKTLAARLGSLRRCCPSPSPQSFPQDTQGGTSFNLGTPFTATVSAGHNGRNLFPTWHTLHRSRFHRTHWAEPSFSHLGTRCAYPSLAVLLSAWQPAIVLPLKRDRYALLLFSFSFIPDLRVDLNPSKKKFTRF